jgi:8-oxo-dGTP diphosphatase
LRELSEEAGVKQATLGKLLGVYSAPHRDFRFHAVTVVIEAVVDPPNSAPLNPLEIKSVKLFNDSELPTELSHHTTEMLDNARAGAVTWE